MTERKEIQFRVQNFRRTDVACIVDERHAQKQGSKKNGKGDKEGEKNEPDGIT